MVGMISMKMGFRWFGNDNDSVKLEEIKQIPGVQSIVWSLHDLPAGEVWPLEKINEVKSEIEQYGFNIDVVESVNIHESIKLGKDDRDVYIDNYIQTIKRLSTVGVKVICYNFMPVFDWIRTDLFGELPDKSTALFYEKSKIDGIDPMLLIDQINANPKYTMPGWEPGRLGQVKQLFDEYKDVSEEDLMENLKYFLDKIMPVCIECDVKMALHPDDPPWRIFGLPRIVTNQESIRKIIELHKSEYHGLTFCTGSLGVRRENNLIDMIKEFKDRIHFAHIRNVKLFDNGNFIETSHLTSDGSIPIDKVVEALHLIDFKGYVRPDHGRHIWKEQCRAGYGLYDRALGIMYLWGLWDAYHNKF